MAQKQLTRGRHKEPASLGSSDREEVVNRAIEVIGDEEQAMRWLGTPVRALDYATPISRLHDSEGQAQVLRVLSQLEHGVL
jgi:putative toxin-antitoxin system antitoxin component (TIGR02293 family)